MFQQGVYCGRCGHWTAAREGQLPRFCPVCGKSMDEPEDRSEVAGAGARGLGAAQPRPSKMAVIAVVLAFVAFRAGFFVSLIALLLGLFARQRINRTPSRLRGRSVADLAMIIALIGMLVRVIR